jgi:molybdopterin-guanine dinucleotide biosynthesis protein A
MKETITGVILAGGRGSRMGGIDKGLQDLNGRPLVQWVLDRLAPQVHTVLISANRNLTRYAEFGYPVLPDSPSGTQGTGPLAGLHAALTAATTPLVAAAPCDSPFLPADLVERLLGAIEAQNADLAVARTADGVQRTFCLMRRELLPQLGAFLASGERKVGLWLTSLNMIEVDFDDESGAFSNINTPQELARYEKRPRA